MVFEAVGYTTELWIFFRQTQHSFSWFWYNSGWTTAETEMEIVDNHGVDVHILCYTLRRNLTYFILNIFLPRVILSFMNIFAFILPVQSEEKAGFAITVFLSL